MAVGVSSFQGQRLIEARLARGLFKNALADLIGVSPMAITRYEQGLDRPHPDKLAAIARQLNFSEAFFCQAPWPEALGLVHWRSRTTETKSAREMTEQRMIWLLELFSFLEKEVEFPVYKLPDVTVNSDFRLLKGSDIEVAAESVREAWGLRDQPIPDMMLALENAGLPVITLEVPSDKQDGFFFQSSILQRGFVGINIHEVSCARARFDAAHELGHAILHKNISIEMSKNTMYHKIIEDQAHRFAGALLFPKKSFFREVGYASLDYLSALKKKWGMSIAAMIMRASDLGLIGKEEKTFLYRSMARRRWRGALQEPFDREMPLERPRMLRRAVDTVVDAGVFGRASFLNAVGLPASEVERLAGLEDGYFLAQNVSPKVSLRRQPVSALDLETGQVIEFPGRRSR